MKRALPKPRPLWVLSLLVALSACAVEPLQSLEGQEAATGWALPPEAAQRLLEMARPYELQGLIEADWRWEGLSVERFGARFLLEGPQGEAALVVRHPEATPSGEELRSPNLQCRVDAGEATGRSAALALAARLVAADRAGEGEGLWRATAREGDLVREFLAETTRYRLIAAGLGAAWLLLIASLLWQALPELVAAWRRRDPAAGRWLIGLLALFLGALALRWLRATWGPGDWTVNLYRVFLDPGGEAHYGAAPNVALRGLFALAPRRHETVVAVNLFLGALAPVFAVLFARALLALGPPPASGGPRRLAVPGTAFAWLVGLFVALQPLFVRHAGEANRQPWQLVLALVALWAATRFLQGGRKSLLAAALSATLLWQQSRPEGVFSVPALLLLVLLAQPWTALRRLRLPPRAWLLGAGVTLTFGLWLLIRPVCMNTFANDFTEGGLSKFVTIGAWLPGPATNAWLDPALTAGALVVLSLAGIALGLGERRRGMLWLGLALLGHSWMTSQYPTGGELLLNARYHTLSVLFATLAAAYALERIGAFAALGLGPRAYLPTLTVGLLAVILTGAGPLARVTEEKTFDLEYHFLLWGAAQLPPEATVHTFRTLAIEEGLIRMYEVIPAVVGVGQRWFPWRGERDLAGPGPHFYYHPALCFSPHLPDEERAICDSALARYGDRALFERTLVRRPVETDRWTQDPVAGFYEMGEVHSP